MWRDIANSLTIGNKRRIPHCGSDNSAIVSKSIKGLHIHCFRCGLQEFVPVNEWSLKELLAAREVQKELRSNTGRMPNDSVPLSDPSVPREARLWVLRAGITPELATDALGIMWSDRYKRVMCPIRQGVILARSVYKEIKPKYLLLGSRSGAFFHMPNEGKPLVLTEDILSAYRVYQAGYSAGAVLGTSLPTEIAYEIATKYKDVLLWLDPDAAGRKGAIAVKKSLALYPVRVRAIKTKYTCDPKYLSVAQIQGEINAEMNGE